MGSGNWSGDPSTRCRRLPPSPPGCAAGKYRKPSFAVKSLFFSRTILKITANFITTLGFAAGVITTVALLPQVIRILRTKQTRDISIAWVLAMTLGVALWLLYGIEKNDPAIIAANSITLMLFLIILFCKFRYG
ncbi:MAG: SemiSWEET transporter [Chlorobiaceae bacterium]|nr:SemiSWEET transporter [Chlorobiaceae bacterium]